MSCKKSCSAGCGCIAYIISTVLAAVGILFFFYLIPNIVTAVWIAFGLGLLSLIFLFTGLLRASACPGGILSKCLCRYGRCLLAGSMGTIVCALAALAIVLSFRWIFVVFLVAVGAFFTVLMLIALFSMLKCLVCALCEEQK